MGSADAVANFFIDRAVQEKMPLTPMALQKLVFYAHGWHLGLTSRPLVNEPVEAWPWGPVFHSLYREFSEFGGSPIMRRARELTVNGNGVMHLIEPEVSDPTGWLPDFLERIWKTYGQYNGIQLSNMTHDTGTPWRQVADQFPTGIPRGLTIPNPLIESYFKDLVEK